MKKVILAGLLALTSACSMAPKTESLKADDLTIACSTDNQGNAEDCI